MACVITITNDGEDGGFLSPPRGGFLSGPKDHSFAEKFLRFLHSEDLEPLQRCEYAGGGSYRYFFDSVDSRRFERWLLRHGAKKLFRKSITVTD